jgi:hypothetical protein
MDRRYKAAWSNLRGLFVYSSTRVPRVISGVAPEILKGPVVFGPAI